MPVATISVNSGTDNQADLTNDVGDTINLADTGGGTPDSRLWSIVRFPGPLAVAPSFSPDAVSQSVSFVAGESGCYIVTLQRTDQGVVSTQSVLVGVRNSLGLIYPVSGLSGQLVNTSAAAQEEGWAGGARASTQVFLDAILRHLIDRSGPARIYLLQGLQNNDTTVDKEIGVARFDPADYDTDALTQYRFRALIETSNAADQCDLLLRNLTTAADVLTISTTSTTITLVESALQTLPTVVTDFGARISLATTGSPNIATCKAAWLSLFP